MIRSIKDQCFENDDLTLVPINDSHAQFMVYLLNTEAWIQFIGDRNIHTVSEAENYIQNCMQNNMAALWVITLKNNHKAPVGIITLIKREQLPYPDIGYALLPNATKKGYASRATQLVIEHIIHYKLLTNLQAITLPHNTNSVKLLQKLNFKAVSELQDKNELLHVYNLEIAEPH